MTFQATYHRTVCESIPVDIEAADYDEAWRAAISLPIESQKVTSREEQDVRLFSLLPQEG